MSRPALTASSTASRSEGDINPLNGADPKIIVLDEPTSSLSEHEAQLLFAALAVLKQAGLAILYISHRLREVMDIADEVTVLRDGALVESRPVAGITPKDMIQMMVGRDVVDLFPKHDAQIGAPVLQVEHLSDGMGVEDVSFEVRAGEIVGFVGLVGAGRTEVARAVFGLSPRPQGTVRVNGRAVRAHNPLAAMRAGIGYVPEDRKQHGIVPPLSVGDNISLPTLRELAKFGITRRGHERRLAQSQSIRLGISPADPSRRIDTLSGGNQQKAVIAKWIAGAPDVLILDEPTRGVDVGAKAEIHRIVGELVAEGLAVLMISSEMPEILAVCDRVYVMHEGRISEPLDRADLTEERLMTLAAGEGGVSLSSATPMGLGEALT
jgi:ABC-type sugar transport system ATPase subunit